MRTAPSFLLSALVALVACGGDDGGDTADGGIDAMLGDPTKLTGQFVVDLVAPVPASGTTPASAGYTSVIGVVLDKPQPQAVIWDESMVAGDCRLLLPRVPFCATPCGGSAVCVADNVCEAYATKQDVGTIAVTGIATTTGATRIELSPFLGTQFTGNYQPPGTVRLAYPPFAAGDAVRFEAPSSAFTPAFTLATAGIGVLALTSPDPALARDQAVELAWTAPAAGATSEVAIQLDISHHGGSRGKIECQAPDSGALTLSAGLITALLDLGAAGFPTIIVVREVTTSALTTAGRVDLVIGAKVERPVTVPGIRSCTEDTECDTGQTCRPDLTCG